MSGTALAVVDTCLLWNSSRFVLEPEGQGNSMPPLQVVFSGHGQVAAAAAASCAAFTLWACASIGTTIHTHTLLSGSYRPLPRSLGDYLHRNGASNLSLRLADVPAKSSTKHAPICAHSCVEVDAITLRARCLPADSAVEGDAIGSGKSHSSASTMSNDLIRSVLARCCMQRQQGYE
jgi:hypothetical protein